MEMPEVVQLEELQSNLDNVMTFLLLFKCRQVDVGQMESLYITHLAQERSKHGQSRQMPNATHFHFLNTVQLHYTQDLHNIF